MKLRPAIPGAIVRDPHSRRPLPPEGAEVANDSSFWHRRLLAGEVILITEEQADHEKPFNLAPVTPLQTRGDDK